MYAHKIKIVAQPSAEVVVRLPDDFPAGTAEVIILSEVRAELAEKVALHEHPTRERQALLRALAEKLPADPALGPVVFHEDAAAPLDESDWPAEMRP